MLRARPGPDVATATATDAGFVPDATAIEGTRPRRRARLGSAVLALLALGLLSPLPLAAETVTVVGSDGTTGSNGAPGVAGEDGGVGGDALVTIGMVTDGDPRAIATGGSGGAGGAGGSGVAGGPVDGADGGAGGDGGDAEAHTAISLAFPSTTPPQSPYAPSPSGPRATGGAGGTGGVGGAPASGGVVGAVGPGGDGGDALAVVDLEGPPGDMQISAEATGGVGGAGSQGGAGGAATVRLDQQPGQVPPPSTTDQYGWHLTATGGEGGAGAGPGGSGGTGGAADASVQMSRFTAQPWLDVRATGGDGGQAVGDADGGDGGVATIGVATVGEATAEAIGSEDVAVLTWAVGGSGGGAATPLATPDGSLGRGGNGASASALHVATPRTTGKAYINHAAEGGSGGSVNGVGPGGDGGSALSEIRHVESSARDYEAWVTAVGGDGGRSLGGPDGQGGNAEAILDVRSSSGGLYLLGNAYAGVGGLDGHASGHQRGLARLFVRGVTEGDGQYIRIGEYRLGREPLRNLAEGGSWHDGVDSFGGDGISHSEGVALADSDVEVIDRAFGGGITVSSPFQPSFGGDAHSTAIARNAGTSRVYADAYARGGGGTIRYGDALAVSEAEGLGIAGAFSDALADSQSCCLEFDGIARATSFAQSERYAAAGSRAQGALGTEATARSLVVPREGPILRAIAEMHATPGPGRRAFVGANIRNAGFGSAPGHSQDLSDVDLDLARPGAPSGELGTLDILLTSNLSPRRGLGGHLDTDVVERALVELAVSVPMSAGQKLVLDFDEASAAGNGFDDLEVFVWFGGVKLLDRAFTDLGEALTFFSTTRLELSDFEGVLTGDLKFVLERSSTTTGDDFQMGASLKLVPEPASGTLVLIGLAWMGARRRSGGQRRVRQADSRL